MVHLISTAALLIGGLFLAWAFQRTRLPYNSEGRFFDPIEGVVYHDSVPVAFGIVGLCFLLGAAAIEVIPFLLRHGRSESDLERDN